MHIVTNKLSNLQLSILQMFNYNLAEKQLLEVKELLAKYFAEKATEEMNLLWDKNKWDNSTMENWANEDLRTSKKDNK